MIPPPAATGAEELISKVVKDEALLKALAAAKAPEGDKA